ncbi:MAG: tetratricopeptide repeat protein [Ignavibacteriae bacterium]|nr:tetratricopeptide repeat protein [Ignavibacteriota bacterium]
MLKYLAPISLGLLMLVIDGCKQYDNFTTYYNTYYNAERLIKETEEDFEYQEEKKRVKPRIIIPDNKMYVPALPKSGPPPFLNEIIISQQKLQPVKTKLDSIIIKGSKILSKHPKSNYIEGTLYLMAMSFFYQNQWINSQIKCSELIDKYPDGELSPDAHLLMAKDYLIQRKFSAGQVLLSRTVDIAWQKKRYDILSEAFRLEAELALFLNDTEGALRPYKQAIVQCEDDEQRARWQLDLAALQYRIGMFEKAEKSFQRVHDYSPDYLGIFEALLYEAASKTRLGKYEEAEQILDRLDGDGKFQEWRANILAERMNILRLQRKDTLFNKLTVYADSSYPNNDAISTVYYEMGMDNYNQNKYVYARNYFARSKIIKTPVSNSADRMYKLLNSWESKRNVTVPLMQRWAIHDTLNDSTLSVFALNLFETGRIHEQLGNTDSAEFYYKLAKDVSPPSEKASARYLYVYARFIEDKEPVETDSILDYLVQAFPTTEYGIDSRKRLGYTDEFLIDTVAEIYKSGVSLRKNKEYQYALQQFLSIYDKYPQNNFAPRALYSVGWTYENDLRNRDSAIHYYLLLMEKYPNSEYARDIRSVVDFTVASKEGKIPDSLRARTLIKYEKNLKIDTVAIQSTEKGKKNKSEFDSPLDIINKPKEFLKSLTEPFSEPEKMLEKATKEILDSNSLKDKMNPAIEFENPFKDLMQDSTTKEEQIKPPK